MASSSSKMCLKLLVDKKAARVLFAEAPKEFVDFVCHIFTLPIGTLIEFLGSKQMVGSLGKLKDSIETLHETYLQPGIKTEDIFNPKTAFNGKTFLLSYEAPSVDDQSAASKSIFRCSNANTSCSYCNRPACRANATLFQNAKCPNCSGAMNVKMNAFVSNDVAVAAVEKSIKGSGYVKEVVTYIVMDDLVVKPMSTISSITLINKFGVKDLSQLEEKVVSFGKDEGLKLLKAPLMTEKVLTTIFMQ